MPCHVGKSEEEYYANLEAEKILDEMNIDKSKDFLIQILCKLCSKMSYQELIDTNLEFWYLEHLFKDGLSEPRRSVAEILRIYN